MSAIAVAAEDYLRVRRALGFKLDSQGRQLAHFVAFLDRAGARTVTTELAVAWATGVPGASERYWHDRLSVARQFAKHLQAMDPTCEIPPKRLLAIRPRRPTPHLFTPEEIAALMIAASKLRGVLHPWTIRTVIGLMAVTGMRIGEVIRLNRKDVDRDLQLLRVLETKFGKSREVSVHPSTLAALSGYAMVRDRACSHPSSRAFFLTRNGTRLHQQCLHFVFRRLIDGTGIEGRGTRERPVPHDLRHSFAVRTLLGWHADGLDVQSRLPLLSTHLGHVEPAATYYYLTAVPELMALVATKLAPIEKGLL
jgi:integrase/recombinase XerD